MNLPQYEFTFPACGKTLTWRPLAIGESLDVTAMNQATPANLGPALLMRRVIRFDGKDGPPSPAEWRVLEEMDYDAFAEDVNEKESARRLLFKKKRHSENMSSAIIAAVLECQQQAANLGRALTSLTEVLEIEKASRDPLGSAAK